MATDYARKSGGGRGQARKNPPAGAASPGKWFSAGLACGVFLSFFAWLAMQPGTAPPTTAEASLAGADAPPKPRFDFYTLLPEQQVRVEVDPAEIAVARGTPTDNEQFLLQAGSFKQAVDADRRRAELLLLGLEARVEETLGDNGRWFRVYIGPFPSRSKMAKARSLTAQQGIDTLLLKRPASAADRG